MAETYNIFISWSKPQAKGAALALRDWLPRVIQATKPWMSEMDIEKGKPWLDELMSALGGLKLGIVCLTAEGLSEPWILFEVGVICKALPETRIWTYLLGGLRHSDVPNPLGIFQHTVATKDDTLRLLQSVNQAMGERAISEEILKDEFERKWKELDTKLHALPVLSEPVRKVRSNEEMFGEIVEAVRAGAVSGKAVEQVRDELRGLREILARVVEVRRGFVLPSSGNLSNYVRYEDVLSGITGVGGSQAIRDQFEEVGRWLAESERARSGVGGGTSITEQEAKARRQEVADLEARLAEIRKGMEQLGIGGTAAKKSDDKAK